MKGWNTEGVEGMDGWMDGWIKLSLRLSFSYLPDKTFKDVLNDEVRLSHDQKQSYMGPAKLKAEKLFQKHIT